MAEDRQKRQKSLKIHNQNAYFRSGISKTVFKILLAQILRKLQIYGINGGGRQEWWKTVKKGNNRSKFTALMLTFDLEFPKLSLTFFLGQILRKLQIYGVNGGGRQEWRKL